ncbi:MAG: efflux RND transporter periplasmic adaptor subunit [Vicinamibacteria bacterium]|nr:efflux RND transporter periplasmic adaptor subunit [Vicinamibacteria bacterium]
MNSRAVSFVLAASSSAFLVACGGSSSAAGSAPAGAKPASRGPMALKVRVAPVTVQDVVYEVKAVGSLEAEEIVQVTAEVEGAVSEVLFREGDHVTPKTVLARIDPEKHRLEAERAEAAYQKALADVERSQADLDRREQLARDQLVAAEELNRSRGETRRLAAEADAVKAARDIAAANQRRSEVRPARAGVINTRTIDAGTWAREGMALATLVDVSRLRLRFKVSEAESLRARDGQDVVFRVSALGDRDFHATIYHVGELADPTTRQVEVLAFVKNPGVLKPGFFAEVRLATESKKGALVVPGSAVQASERGFIAYVVEGGKAVLRPLQIGLRTPDGSVEVISGLKAGETVVVEGSDRIGDGVAVEAVGDEVIKPSAEPAAPSQGAR